MDPRDSKSSLGKPGAETTAAGGTGAVPLAPSYESRTGGPATGARRTRGISLVARGEPMVWLTGGVTALAMLMIVGLLGFITVMGFTTFWPSPLAEVKFKPNGVGDEFRTILGEPFRSESFRPAGTPAGVFADRTLYRVGNVDLTGERFVWINDADIASTSNPTDAVLIERTEWGNAYGYIEAVADGGGLTTGAAAWDKYLAVHDPMREAAEKMVHLQEHEIGQISKERRDLYLELRAVELEQGANSQAYRDLQNQQAARISELDELEAGYKAQVAELVRQMAAVRVYVRTIQGQIIPAQRDQMLRPLQSALLTGEQKATVRLADVTEGGTVSREGQELVVQFHQPDKQPRIELLDANGNVLETIPMWPMSRITVTDGQQVDASTQLANRANPLQVSQIVRAYKPNAQDTGDKLGTYFGRWWEFLSENPREANTEGGVFPAIVGTVLMTFVMIIFVVPLGVIAAIYLREYAKQGLLVTIIRISVNNLAGVPSIVFGVFGLAFFIYGLGQWIDQGPQTPMSRSGWFTLLVITCTLVVGAVLLSWLASRTARHENQRLPATFKWGGVLLWSISAGTVCWLIAQTPFFQGFYAVEASEGSPVVGKSAMLWASLTLALLTLPVVIVATEEALSAVPRSMREGSYACGASKWQTIRRIVLPRALPGIMTGTILAVARGAGEVAPIMLVGAVKLAPELPIAADFPWFGTDRSFMHLGFHIYDVGFQSPDSENARPLVFTTTFLLIAIVVLLNLSAMLLRSRLRKAYSGGAF